jgi:TorA maturation chaperone TorD
MQDARYAPDERDWPALLTGQSLLFNLLARLLLEYPQEAWLKDVIDQDVFAEVPFGADQPAVREGTRLIQGWITSHGGQLTPGAFDELRADYTRLFIGPAKVLAPPWESFYFNEERLLFQEQTLQVRQWFRRFGMESENIYKEPDDHIGLELAFLASLAQLALQALNEGDQARFQDASAAQSQFLEQHPAKWVSSWHLLVQQEARTDFMRGVASLVEGSLQELAELHGLRIEPAKVEREDGPHH